MDNIFGSIDIGKPTFNPVGAMPALFITPDGAGRQLVQTAYEWTLAVQYEDSIYAVVEIAGDADPATIWKYTTATGWVDKETTGLDASLDEAYLLYVDSSGTIFISFTTGDKMYSSTDDGATFAAIASLNQTISQDGEYRAIAEDELGDLYTGYYDPDAPADGTLVFLGKSTDGGATFTDITANLLNTSGMKHIHSTFYDPHRKILFVCPGDRGVTEKIQYSTDYGATFNTWEGSPGQTICMTFDAKYIYMHVELTATADSSIYRASGVTDTATKVQDINFNNSGIGWNGYSDSYGNVWFCLGETEKDQVRIYATTDHGDTWYDIYPSAWAVADISKYKRVARASYYAGGEDNWFFSSGYTYRVFPPQHNFDIDEAAGSDWLVNPTKSWNTIPDNGGVTGNGTIRLIDDFAGNPMLGTSGITVNTNGYSFTDYPVTGTLAVDENFETGGQVPGDVFNNTVGAAMDLNSAGPGSLPTGSTECLLCPGAGGAGSYGEIYSVYSGMSSGDIAYWQAYIYFDAVAIDNFNSGIFGGITNLGDIEFRNNGRPQFSFTRPSYTGRIRYDLVAPAVPYAFPVQTWVKLRLAAKYGVEGWVRIYADDVLVFEVMGCGEMTNNGTVWSRASYGWRGSQVVDVYYDQIKASVNFDPDKPSAPIAGTSQAILPDGIYT